MRLIVDNSIVELDDNYLFYNEIGNGTEGTVYRYLDYALKIYHKDSNKYRLGEKEILTLTELSTERLLLPKKIVYKEDGNVAGYMTKLCQMYSLNHIENMSISRFIDEVKIIEKDSDYLGDNGIGIEDLHRGNIVYDGNINLVDPGSFCIEDTNSRHIKILNGECINNFIIEEILLPISKNVLSNKKSRELYNNLSSYIDCYISNVMDETSLEKDTVKSYIKRMGK